jgi:hypothetical protein
MKPAQDILINHYRQLEKRGSPPFEVKRIGAYDKLGDSVFLTRIPKKAQEENKELYIDVVGNRFITPLLDGNHFYKPAPDHLKNWTFHHMVESYNCGNGNILQQTYRLLGLKVDSKPKGYFNYNPAKNKKLIGIHVDGVSAGNIVGAGTARMIYPKNLELIQKFILENQNRYKFVQFGLAKAFQGVEDFTGIPLVESIRKAAECEYAICLNSGFMHVFAMFDVKIVCVINSPFLQHCYFPVLVNEMPECHPLRYDRVWLYPQAVHLHQDGENELVPCFSLENLQKALDGEVYPYWSDCWLDLIYEHI